MTYAILRAGAALSALALTAPGWAQSTDGNAASLVDENADQAIPLVEDRTDQTTITVTGFNVRVDDTGHAVTVLDADEIDAVQGPDLTRVLTRVPSVVFNRNGPLGAFTAVRVRGGANEQLLVLIDGVRVSDPAAPSGGFDFGTLTTGTIGKIDVLRGSNSTIWGSDAVAGVIDISSRGAPGVQGQVEYGARDTLSARASAGIESDATYAGVGASYVTTDGFSAAAAGSEADGFEQIAVTGSVFHSLTSTVELFAQGRYAQGENEFDGFPPPTFALADTLDVQDSEQLSAIVGANYFGQDLSLRASASFADTSRDNFDEGTGVTTFTSDGQSRLVQLRGEYRLIGGLTLAFGGSSEWTDYETLFDAGNDANITGGYVQAGWVLGNLAARAGVRIDDHSAFGSETSFGGDVSYALGNGWRLRASAGEGYRAPSLFQLYSDFGNAELQPETSTSFDVGVAKTSTDGRFAFAATAFRRTSANLIDFDLDTFTYANLARARAQGFELELTLRPTDRLGLGSAYAYTEAENRDTGLALARRPRHALSVWGDWETPLGLILGGDVRLVGGSFDNAGNTVPLDGYVTLDLRARYPIGDAFELFGRVENVFDTAYETAAGYASAPRGAFAGIRVGL